MSEVLREMSLSEKVVSKCSPDVVMDFIALGVTGVNIYLTSIFKSKCSINIRQIMSREHHTISVAVYIFFCFKLSCLGFIMNMSIRFKLALVKEFGSKNMGCFFYIIPKEGYSVEFSHHFYAGCHFV
jgi:hypothetical protein